MIILEPGCIIPADCLLIEGSDLTVDETPLLGPVPEYPHELNEEEERARLEEERKRKIFEKVNKSPCNDGDDFRVKDPFLYSGSIMLSGSGKALVCVVGEKSNRPKIDFDTDAKTPL